MGAGNVTYVYSEEPSHNWSNPSMVVRNEIMRIEWISESSGVDLGAGHRAACLCRLLVDGSVLRRRPLSLNLVNNLHDARA